MTALAAQEASPALDAGAAASPAAEPTPDLDEVLWQAWKAMELPEGFRAEIVEGSIEVSPTGRRRHGVLINRLRRVLETHLAGSEWSVHHDVNVIDRRRVWIPDLFVAPEDLEEIADEDGLGVEARGVAAVVEVASPGYDNLQRDRVRKRRSYAQAGIPLYVLVDDHDGDGVVSLLTSPDPEKAVYTDEHRVPYGTDAVVQDGPVKGLVIGAEVVRS